MKSKIVHLFLLCGCYLSILAGIYIVHISFFEINVVFYAAIADIVIATFLSCLACFFLRPQWFTAFEKLLITLCLILVGYAFAISIPTVLDRSLSFYILEKIDQRGGGILQERFASVFTEEYLVEHRLVDVRLTEQFESGTITNVNGCIVLTNRGKKLVAVSRWFRLNLLPKHRLLMGTYTDVLTDPFRNSQVLSPENDYRCTPRAN